MPVPRLTAACAASCTLFLSAFAGAAYSGEAFEAVTEPQFQSAIVGKSLAYDNGGTLTFHPDGTLTGNFARGAASGTWSWDAGRICSRTTVGQKTYDPTCRTPETNGKRLRFLQADGSVYSVATIQ